MPEVNPASLNRVRLFEALSAVLRRVERTRRPAGLLAVSVNALGAVNTQLGIDVGNELIAHVGRLLKAKLTGSDTVGRYGSNTFAIILDGRDPARLQETAEEIIALIRGATIPTAAGPMAASVSVGGVALPGDARTVSEAFQHSLTALELAKTRPAGAFVAYTPELAAERSLLRGKAVASSVIGALEEGRMVLMLQPIVRASDRQLAFYEGLLRLRRSDGVLIPASDFIEDAESLGLAQLVDKRALELGLTLLAEHPDLKLSVNISGLTAGDEAWMATLRAFAGERPDILARLGVEMTETAMIHDFDAAAAFFDGLRALGCKVALDDFGAGYTSFRHLRLLNVDMLKIDGAFVTNALREERSRVLVTSMIEMAKGLGLETVAEWVGDEDTAAFLAAAGATYLQGFLYGEPMTVEELKRRGAL